jgi:hypothetical protein
VNLTPTGGKSRMARIAPRCCHRNFSPLLKSGPDAVGTPVAQRRRVAPGDFTPRRSQNRA